MNKAVFFVILVLAGAGLGFLSGIISAPMVFDTPVFISSMGASAVPVTVPDVLGMTRSGAQSSIEGGNLVLAGQWTEYGDFETMGLVVRQDPPPGTQVPQGAPVNIFWNVGPLFRPFFPDSIIGLSASRAEEKIADWQLYTAGRTRIPHPSIPEGVVIAVAPWFAESISVKRPVRLLVSSGWTGVPVLVGLRVAEADSILSGRRLVMKIIEERAVTDILKEGTILEQFPYSGEQYMQGDTVSVVTGAVGAGGWGEW
ncbi:MAG: PASTA domain-containing protein [Candidatus Sabulitectum sp.]|nr:PASTA domain-containing protein [Candidatus Sabulitectum sp.]